MAKSTMVQNRATPALRAGLTARAVNPFTRLRRQIPAAYAPVANVYHTLPQRIAGANAEQQLKLTAAVAALKTRLGGAQYSKESFGRIVELRLDQLMINIENQRNVEWEHLNKIIQEFDPRIVQVINVIDIGNDQYSIPEGQHTAIVLKILAMSGIVPPDMPVVAKVIPSDLTVPGSALTGEAFGNLLFRVINTYGRKAVDNYFVHFCKVQAVRRWGSQDPEDLEAELIQTVVDRNNCYLAPKVKNKLPGMITHIDSVYKIANSAKNKLNSNLDQDLQDLDITLRMHDLYFANENGVHGGFILGIGRYMKSAREAEITITDEHMHDLAQCMRVTYGSPASYNAQCKTRLENFCKANSIQYSWRDVALTPILIQDFDRYCAKHGLNHPQVGDPHQREFAGV